MRKKGEPVDGAARTRTSSWSPGAAFLLALVFALGWAPAALADAWSSFKDARDIVENGGDLARAEVLLRQAIAEEPESDQRLIRRYVPHYYLGRVLAERGECRGALAAWAQAKNYGALKEDQQADMESRVDRCRQQVGAAAEAEKRAESSLARARERSTSVGTLARRPMLQPLWNEGSPSFADRQRSATREIQALATEIAQAGEALDLDRLAAAEQQAREIVGQLETLSNDARARLAAVSSALGEASGRLEEAVTELQRLVRSVAGLDPLPPRLAAAVADARQELAEVERVEAESDADAMAALAEKLEATSARLAPLAGGPPRSLRRAAEAYLANEFETALEILAEASFRSERSRFHSALLQAASAYGAWMAGGGQPGELRDRLDAALRQTIAFDPAPGRPSERFYPPGFRALYEAALGETALDETTVEQSAAADADPAGE